MTKCRVKLNGEYVRMELREYGFLLDSRIFREDYNFPDNDLTVMVEHDVGDTPSVQSRFDHARKELSKAGVDLDTVMVQHVDFSDW